MATHSHTLAWKIPWTEEPRRLQSMGSQSQTRLSNFTVTLWTEVVIGPPGMHRSSLCSASPSLIHSQYLESHFSPFCCSHPGPDPRLTGLGVSTLVPVACSPRTARRTLVKPTSKRSTPGLDCSKSPLTQLHPSHTCTHHIPQTLQPHSYLRTLAFVSVPGTLF